MGRLSLLRDQQQGRARGALAPLPWLRALLQRTARHHHRSVPGDLQERRARPARSRAGHAVSAFRTASAAASIAHEPLTFTFDGKAYQGLRRRHAGLGAARQRRASGRALVQISPAARHSGGRLRGAQRAGRRVGATRRATRRICARPRSSSTRAWRPRARIAGPASSFDFGAHQRLAVAPFIPAGFYYKTFMWPAAPGKRLRAGRSARARDSGRAPTRPDPDRYAQRYAHCDVLVVGAGPAGLAAALAARASGARVIICDEQAQFGGSLLGEPRRGHRRRAAADWLRAHARGAAPQSRASRLLPRTTAFGYFPHNLDRLERALTDHLAAPPSQLPRERLWQVRAREVVLATGAIERPLVFPGNDRPGIMLAGAARTYLQSLRRALPGARRRRDRLRCGLPGGARSARGGRRDRGDRRYPAAAAERPLAEAARARRHRRCASA